MLEVSNGGIVINVSKYNLISKNILVSLTQTMSTTKHLEIDNKLILQSMNKISKQYLIFGYIRWIETLLMKQVIPDVVYRLILSWIFPLDMICIGDEV